MTHSRSGADPHADDYARDVLENMSEAFFLLDRGFRLVDVNRAAIALDGRAKEDLLGRTLWELAPGVEESELGEQFKWVMLNREAQTAVHHQSWDGGHSAWLESRIVPVQAGVAAFYRDVTKELAAQERLRETSRRLDAILGNTTMAVFLMDHQQQCVYANAAAEKLTGYAFEEMRGRPLHDVVHHTKPDGSHYPLADCPIDRAFPERAQMQGEEIFVAPDGSFYPVAFTASPLLDQSGAPAGTVIEARNIEQEKAKQVRFEVLNRTGQALAVELDLNRVVQIVTDAGVELSGAKFGAFFYNVINDDGESFLLYTLSGAEREQFDSFGHPRATEVFAPTFQGEGVVRSDDITKDPRYGNNSPHNGMPQGHLPVRSYLAVPVTSRSGEVIGGLFFAHPEPGIFGEEAEPLLLGLAGQAAIAIDNARLFEAAQRANQSLEQRVVERTRELEIANDALRQSQKMEAIGQLTGGIAHDFNNLLTVIRGSADVLRRDGLTEEKRRRYIDAISDTAERAARLTGQLLAFARRQALRPEVFDAGQRITSIAEMLRSVLGSRICLEIDARCSDCFVEADIAQFEAALVNMAVNARDAMDGEGELKIAIRREMEGESALVCVEVADTGHGIEPEKLNRIFEPFYTTKEVGKGTGLGLSQVYGFIKQSDGEIQVESRLGAGTIFRLLLLARDDRPSSSPQEHEMEPLPKGGRVLVVEDNADVRNFAVDLLQDLGFEAEVADCGHTALEKLSADSRFDVIFSDVVMPGMSGIELARSVRQNFPHMPIVLTSGYSHVLVDEGRHGFPLLHKPYSAEGVAKALFEAMSTVAHRPGAQT
ncbi:PAS domain-containing protein [Sphingomonas xinjiangensis]|uniref:histidine kinase n=1 Tax=Sphingomonas xinjiangensis TaxID=643568 RepID=A0A840YFP3_9SPHN|nr:PAS domain-containing protein [Sphingomonas xinjiangensis]MBB5711644.1 PAS domain S-box-containing protein [Sphingomonas xinjiangensis]